MRLCCQRRNRPQNTDAFLTGFRARFVLCTVFLLAFFTAAADVPTHERRILFIDSFDSATPWSRDIRKGFRESIEKSAGSSIKIEFYELGTLRTPDFKPTVRDTEYLKQLLNRKPFDLIVTVGASATELAQELVRDPAPKLPIVFCAGLRFDRAKRVYPNITGIERGLKPDVVLDLAMKLFPLTNQVAIVTDGGTTGDSCAREFRRASERQGDTEFLYFQGDAFSTDELLTHLAALPENSIIILDNWQSTRKEAHLPYEVVCDLIRKNSTQPIFPLRGSPAAPGLLGCVQSDDVKLGTETASLAQRVLAGEAAAGIPIRSGPVRVAFNDETLRKLDIPRKLLPGNTVLFNQPPPLGARLLIVSLPVCLGALLLISIAIFLNRRNRKRQNGLFAALPIHVGVADEKGRLLFYQAENNMFSSQRPRRMDDLSLELLREIRKPVAETFQTGESRQVAYSVFGRYLELDILPLPSALFGRPAVMWISADVTRLHEQNEQLQSAVESALAANRGKNNVILNMSYHLRTPLEVVMGLSEFLLNVDLTTEERREYLQAIHRAGETILGFANNVFDFSAIESDQLEIAPAPMNLSGMLSETATIFRAHVASRNLELHLDLPECLPWVVLDQLRLRQILLNLLDRIIKSNENGRIDISVVFTETDSDRKSGTLVITLLGTSGNSDPASENIGSTLVTTSGLPAEPAGDVELEFLLSERLCSHMGGTIRMADEHPFQDNPVTIEFKEVVSTDSGLNSADELPATSDNTGDYVLLVDDAEMSLKITSAMLKRLNIAHCCCTSVKEAIQRLETGLPRLVLTDLWMPEAGGDDLARYIAEHYAAASIPVVAVTADSQMDRNTRTLFAEVILKPVSLAMLRQCLQKVMPELAQ